MADPLHHRDELDAALAFAAAQARTDVVRTLIATLAG